MMGFAGSIAIGLMATNPMWAGGGFAMKLTWKTHSGLGKWQTINNMGRSY